MLKLSHKLLDLGFFSALGTMEYGKVRDENYVRRGTPKTYDHNNGVLVIYDEEGRPWISEFCIGWEALNALISDYNLKHDAYVPHSNDGGHFVKDILPKLQKT